MDSQSGSSKHSRGGRVDPYSPLRTCGVSQCKRYAAKNDQYCPHHLDRTAVPESRSNTPQRLLVPISEDTFAASLQLPEQAASDISLGSFRKEMWPRKAKRLPVCYTACGSKLFFDCFHDIGHGEWQGSVQHIEHGNTSAVAASISPSEGAASTVAFTPHCGSADAATGCGGSVSSYAPTVPFRTCPSMIRESTPASTQRCDPLQPVGLAPFPPSRTPSAKSIGPTSIETEHVLPQSVERYTGRVDVTPDSRGDGRRLQVSRSDVTPDSRGDGRRLQVSRSRYVVGRKAKSHRTHHQSARDPRCNHSYTSSSRSTRSRSSSNTSSSRSSSYSSCSSSPSTDCASSRGNTRTSRVAICPPPAPHHRMVALMGGFDNPYRNPASGRFLRSVQMHKDKFDNFAAKSSDRQVYMYYGN